MGLPKQPANETLRADMWRACDILCRDNNVGGVMQYTEYEMPSWSAKRYFQGVAKKTTNLATRNQSKLSSFCVLFPALSEQRRIVAYLNDIKMEIGDMASTQSAVAAWIAQME